MLLMLLMSGVEGGVLSRCRAIVLIPLELFAVACIVGCASAAPHK